MLDSSARSEKGRSSRPLTFLFTDIEDSARYWEENAEAIRYALAHYDALMRRIVETHGGHLFKTVGDAFCVAFESSMQALEAALAVQRAWIQHAEHGSGDHAAPVSSSLRPYRIRMALHNGEAEAREGDYFGPPLNRTARMLAVGHGGQVLLSLAAAEQVRETLPAGAGLQDLGLHPLRDLPQPEHIFQLLHPDLPADFPPLRSLAALPNNLPPRMTSFIGRERELAEIKRILRREAVSSQHSTLASRLITLTGAGGSGKTRLALQVAADLLGEFPDGVWWAELDTISDPQALPGLVASVLSVPVDGRRPITESLVACLRTRCLLLVLDTCEHLRSAAAALAETLLAACPAFSLLATSREPLGVFGELVRRIPPLSLPTLESLPEAGPGRVEALQSSEAVRLFVDRARLARPQFVMTEQNAAAILGVCRYLDGLPLPIEMAAARVRVLTVEQIAARLEDSFRLFRGGVGNPRHQSLRALIDWSYEQLPAAEQTLLRRLAALPSSWTAEEAAQIAPGTDTQDLLDALIQKSLVEIEETAEGARRYRLLEIVRGYAREKAREAGEGGERK